MNVNTIDRTNNGALRYVLMIGFKKSVPVTAVSPLRPNFIAVEYNEPIFIVRQIN
jgi:hypothetical protein